MANIKICDELQIGKESANIDARYGPWQSKGEAVTTLSKWGTIAKGLTVGIIENNKIVEYWFQGGTDLDHLILKNNGGGDSGSIEGAELQANKVTSIRTDVNEPEDSPTAPSNDKYPSERAVALLYDNLETDVTETNRKIGDLSHFQDNQDYNPDPDNLNIGDILKGLETKIVEFNWALEGTDADKDSNVFNNTPYSGYSVWKVLGELYNAVQKKKYNVRFTVTNGSKDPDNNYTNVPEGDTIEWVVTPYVNYKMPSRIDGAVIEDLNNGTYKVTVSDIQEDTEITCECIPIEQHVTTHNVTISVNNGTVNGESQKVFHVEHNSGISCVLEANEYYHIPTSLPYSHMSISDTGILSITNVTADIEITIDCIKNKYTVTLNISNGTTTSDNPQQVDAFGSAVFNLAADQYYELPAKTSNNIAIVNGVLTVNNITSDQTISVVCKVKDCFVVFNLDGGTGDTPGALHVDANTSIPLPIYDGTKDGYTLIDSDNASWWIITDDTGTHEARMGGDYTIISNTTIKPKWFTSSEVTVTFDMKYPNCPTPESMTVERNEPITLPYSNNYSLMDLSGERTLVFSKWTPDENANEDSTPTYSGNTSYTVTEDTTLYAITKIVDNPYIHIFDNTDALISDSHIINRVSYGSKFTYPQCPFEAPAGKTFDKWSRKEGSLDATPMDCPPGTFVPKLRTDLYIYAVWKETTYHLSFYIKDTDNTGQPKGINASYGETVQLPSEYKIVKYRSSSGEIYGKRITGWIDTNTNEVYELGASVTVTENMRFEAQVEDQFLPIHTITFTGSNQSSISTTGSMDAVELLEGDNFITPTTCDFSRQGYHFDELWNVTKADSSATQEGLKTRYEAGEAIQAVTTDLVLNPIWQQNGYYRVTYDVDGGSVLLDSENRPSIASGAVITLPSSYSGTKEGFMFTDTWIITDANGTVEKAVNSTHTIVSNTRIKPKWVEASGYLYYLTNTIPNAVPTFNTSQSNELKLGQLQGFSNWKDKKDQFIVFQNKTPYVSKTPDYYFTLTDMFGGDLTEYFIRNTDISNTLSKQIYIAQWNGNPPLEQDDGTTATITFK